jgi:predicted exporter/outer membrane lipoprotein-sorting protein
MKRLAIWIPLLAVVCLVALLPRLRFDVDVFNLLPADSRMVEGLKLYQRTFGSSGELILSVRSSDAEASTRAARALAQDLERDDLTSRVVWRNPFLDDSDAMGELLAYLWLNQSPQVFSGLAERFADDRLQPTLDETLERLTTSLRPQEVARLSQDPFALTDLPQEIPDSLGTTGDDPFASADGSFRILFVQPPFEQAGFWETRRWVGRVGDYLEAWKHEAADEAVTIGMTGDPAFISEIGSGLLRDMQLAALGTLLIVGALFWVAHRRWGPLIWLVTLLVFVLAATMAVGGLLFGAINAVALGFAAVLLGLAADYGLILYQEFVAEPGRSVVRLRAAIAPSILWAAATTAGAFVMISRSSLPGLTQLGTLVAVGILIAAVVMLVGFLPPIAGPASVRRPAPGDSSGAIRGFATQTRPAWWVTWLAIGAALTVLAFRHPVVDYGTDDLGPKDAAAQIAFEEIQREIGGQNDPVWLILAGADESEVARRMQRTRSVLDAAVEAGSLEGFTLPDALWPNAEAQQANRTTAGELAGRLPMTTAAALESGFTRDALQLTKATFAAWGHFATADAVLWPSHPAAEWAFRKFTANDADRRLALGGLQLSNGTTNAELMQLDSTLGDADGGRLYGWPLLGESLLETMQRDVARVLLPMGIVLLLFLGIAFRRVGEIVLSLASLVFSTLCLLAVMALLGWSWNLMNVMALPLLFGAGVDYSIHIQLALRRHGGDVARVRRTVGRAILLCGTSTAAGFGTLAFASNAGVSSLGRVCAVGILIASFTSIALLPVWWRALKERTGGLPMAVRVAGLILLALLPVATLAETAEPTAILDAWLKQQAQIKTWSADVTQTRKLESLTRPLESEGKVWFIHPNRFRWQLGDPPRTIAVRSETELSVLYPRLEQAERYPLGDDLDPAWRQALALLEVGFPSDRDQFYARYEPLSATREGDTWRLVVRPAAKEARRLIEEVRFEVSAEDYVLRATELAFPDGSTMRNAFRGHRLNPELDAALFEVDLSGYEVSNPLDRRN